MHGYILLGINKSLTSTFRISAIWYKTGSGGCTLLAAYRLTALKLLPNRCAKSVWLIPLTSRIFLILFINISSCLRKDTLFYCVSNCFIRTIFQHTGFCRSEINILHVSFLIDLLINQHTKTKYSLYKLHNGTYM